MGTLRKLKLQLKLDKNLRHMMIKGCRNEILIDLDGDKQADLAFIDQCGDGNIDTIAVDLGDDDTTLYFIDTDHNNVPDAILVDERGRSEISALACGKEVEAAILSAAQALFAAIEFGEYVTSVLDACLDELEKEIKKAKKTYRK